MKKILSATYWVVLILLLYFFLETTGRFHFFFMEQTGLFLYCPDTLWSALSLPSGFAAMISGFLMQFFALPHFGAVILSLVLGATGITTFLALRKKIDSTLVCAALASAAPVAQAFILFNENLSYTEPVALLMLALSLLWYCSLKPSRLKMAYASAIALLLFWLTGAAAIPFVVIVAAEELCDNPRRLDALVPAVLVGALLAISIKAQMFGDYRDLLLPDNYYNLRLHPAKLIYVAWFSLPTFWLLALIFRKAGLLKKSPVLAAIIFAVGIICGAFIINTKAPKPDFYEELDYYARNGRWEDLLKAKQGKSGSNHLYSALRNMALAETGQLGDKMFSLPQTGVEGLYIQWKPIPYLSILQSELYWSMGYISQAQRSAFNANLSYGDLNPRMLMRLVDTNIVYGQYTVAEKYISVLEKSWRYREWASARRALLWDDAAVMADPELSAKRKCIPAENTLSGSDGGSPLDLALIAESNPAHKASIEYLGGIFLLASDIANFMDLVDKYYGTDVLPTLPKAFQEAILVYTERYPEAQSKYEISDEVLLHYAAFRDCYFKNKGKSGLQSQLKARFGDTFWVYYLATS